MPESRIPHRDETDVLFDTSPRALAARFGRRTIEHIHQQRDPYEAARMAASWAFLAEPSWRIEETPQSAFSDALFRFGVAMAERVQ